MPIAVPQAMKSELGRWNNGRGISVEDWITCVGNMDLAVGYSTVFWPTFEAVGDYILTEGWTDETVRGFEKQPNSTPQGVEWVMNHRHMIDIHLSNDVEPTVDHLLRLGTTLKEIYSAKLAWQFPDRPCEVEFYVPEEADALVDYQISFWQKKMGRNRLSLSGSFVSKVEARPIPSHFRSGSTFAGFDSAPGRSIYPQ